MIENIVEEKLKRIYLENVYIDKQDLFPCYSPLFKEFLEELKEIYSIGEKINTYTSKKCWYFLRTQKFEEALLDWRGRKYNKLWYSSEEK